MNIEKATSQPFQVSRIMKEEPERLEMILTVALISLTKSMNAKHTMDSAQIDECMVLLIERYWYFKPEEFLLIFKMGKMGDFGTDYNRLDILTIFQWCKIYCEKHRAPHFEKLNDGMKPEPVPVDSILSQYATLKTQTIQSGTNDLKNRLSAKKQASVKEEFQIYYREQYAKEKDKFGFDLQKFDAAMEIVKRKLGIEHE